MIKAILDLGTIVAGRYKIGAILGEGGMQQVYKATDTLLCRRVALKVPKTLSAVKRFKSSAVVSARVNHANVAKTLDYVDENGNSYLIEEYIDGKDLGAILRDDLECIDPYLVSKVLHHLARGLAASHHAGVIHRDLKPGNIMSVSGLAFHTVKITDFGIAKMAESEVGDAIEGGDETLTASQTAIGALPYMAPETIQSFSNSGKPSDVWALGALSYELLSGIKPFGSGLRAVEHIVKAHPPSPPKTIVANSQFQPLGKELYDLILRCLKKNPDERPSADELIKLCEELCYSLQPREVGIVNSTRFNSQGFIVPKIGKSLFFHRDSIFGSSFPKVGDKVTFGRDQGGGNDRAFPLIVLKSKKPKASVNTL